MKGERFKMAEFSPMMQHYLKTKEEYKDCILFYRLGDFYEMFFDDAHTASRELEITLTGKECGQEERAPMCGVPYHAAEMYIAKLIEKGYKVAICEQLEDPKQAKGIVKRDVIRIVTPGTVIETNILEEKKNNYIMSIYKNGIYFGIAVCDVSTGDFYASEINETNNFEKLLDELSRYNPAEIIANDLLFNTKQEITKIKERFSSYISYLSDEKFKNDMDKLKIYNYIDTDKNEIDFNEIEKNTLLKTAIIGLLEYIVQTQKTKLNHINTVEIYSLKRYMALDISARRNLEITEKLRDKTKKGTLLWVLDKTSTSMGGRALRRWISNPLIDIKEINRRLDSVEELKNNIMLKGEVIDNLKRVYDIERLIGKISFGNANARDLISLKNSVAQIPEIKKVLSNVNTTMLKDSFVELDELKDIYELIDKAIIEEPPISVKEGGIIKLGYNDTVDELKKASIEGKNWLIELEVKERAETGIKNLKIAFNKVFGYYFEVTKSFLSQVPERFVRKQTLTNCERFITEELKELEEKILGSQDKLIDLEYNLFIEIRNKLASNIERIQKTANIIATLDVLTSLATVAEDMGYVKPIVDEEGIIEIKDGRHPVIDKMLPYGEFVPNDTYLDKNESRLSIITGPNMAGKSTYMRQVALITLMAQIGSFVPASYAKIGVVDKIFTRVGASDDLAMRTKYIYGRNDGSSKYSKRSNE